MRSVLRSQAESQFSLPGRRRRDAEGSSIELSVKSLTGGKALNGRHLEVDYTLQYALITPAAGDLDRLWICVHAQYAAMYTDTRERSLFLGAIV
jgi:hypothetical protein